MNPSDYEQFVSKLIDRLARQELTVKPIIAQRRNLVGRSGQSYEIDLSYTFRVAGVDYLTAIECKCWNHSVGRDIVSAFRTVLDDISAHKGIIVTTQGFQSGALAAAASYGIALLTASTETEAEVLQHLHGEGERAATDLILCPMTSLSH
jgi:restriction endonuclease Mrr